MIFCFLGKIASARAVKQEAGTAETVEGSRSQSFAFKRQSLVIVTNTYIVRDFK